MMNFAPASSLDTLSQNPKNSDLDTSTGQAVRSTQSRKKKKQKPSLESYKVHIGIGINSSGEVDFRCSEGLDHLGHDLIRLVSDTLSQLAQAQQFEEEDIPLNPQKAFRRNDDSYKSTSWQLQPHYSNEDSFLNGSTSLLSQMALKRRRVSSPSLQAQDMAMSEFGTHQNFAPSHGSSSTNCLNITNIPSAPINRPQMGIRLDDQTKWWEWFQSAFLAIQQQACRLIAKEWIKAIHPKKQSTNPYNGNFPRNQQADPDKTRPSYWPPGILHREPDHIDRAARTLLLVHLLMHTPQKEISPSEGGPTRFLVAADLMETLSKKKEEVKDKWEIIQEVIAARSKLEAFNEGGYDGETVVYVRNYSENHRSTTNGKKQRTKSKPDIKAGNTATSSSNDIDEMYAGSPTPPVSPSNSIPTPNESERSDDMSALNASFTSTTTQKTTKSTVPILRPKPVEPSNSQSHINAQALEHHPMLVDPEQSYSSIVIKQDQMHPAWAGVDVPISQMHGIYTSSALAPSISIQAAENAYFGHEMYGMPHQVAMHGIGPHVGYHPSHIFPCDYGRGIHEGAYLRNMSDIREMGSDHDFQLHDQYARIQAQAQRSHQ